MNHRAALLAFATLGVTAPAVVPFAAQDTLVVVVHPTNSLHNISLADLRRLYLGETTNFPSGGRASLMEYVPDRTRFYQLVLGMTPDLLQRHWMAVVFRGEDASPPKAVSDPEELRRFVAEHPDAVGFMSQSGVDSTVKVVTVDGRPPGHPRYPLR